MTAVITPPRASGLAPETQPETPLDTAYYIKNNPYAKPARANEQLKFIIGTRRRPASRRARTQLRRAVCRCRAMG